MPGVMRSSRQSLVEGNRGICEDIKRAVLFPLLVATESRRGKVGSCAEGRCAAQLVPKHVLETSHAEIQPNQKQSD